MGIQLDHQVRRVDVEDVVVVGLGDVVRAGRGGGDLPRCLGSQTGGK